jgi:tetratricopeptide (TPR) repeat protein
MGAVGLGRVEMLAGDPMAAERQLRSAFAALEEAGETGSLSTVAAELADALYAQGHFEEAQRYTRVSEEAAASDDYASQILWRSVRAKAIAREDPDGAEQLARAAVTLAADTDDIDRRGESFMALAEVLLLAERPDEANPVIREALCLYEKKGNLVSAARARALLSSHGEWTG